MEEEKIVGIIPTLNSNSIFRKKAHTMIVTNQRLILAQQTKNLLKKHQKQETKKTNKKRKRTLSNTETSMPSNYYIYQKYNNMDPDEILKESPKNYEIKLNDIKSTKLRTGPYNQEYVKEASHRMIIKWHGGKKKFIVKRTSPQTVKRILTPLLGARVN